MKALYEYINQKRIETVVDKESLKTVPLKLHNKPFEIAQEFAGSYVKSDILKNVGEWYEENPTRRNIEAYSGINIFFFGGGDGNNRLLKEVLNELERIGVTGEMDEFVPALPDQLHRGRYLGGCGVKFSVNTYKQFKDGNYNITTGDSTVHNELNFIESKSNNGYNGLSAKDKTILRQKLYDCMVDTDYDIISVPSIRSKFVPDYRVRLIAVYDDAKLRKYLKELKSDHRLQNFADKMDEISKGIGNYYASKRSGDYTGD